MSDGVQVRLRTFGAKKRALDQLTELRGQGVVGKALVIVERKDGNLEVLGQEMHASDGPRLLYAATMAFQHVDAAGGLLRLESHMMPVRKGERVGLTMKGAIKTGTDGTLIPPPGENFMSCGECDHPKFFVLLADAEPDGMPARLACSHCGNEVKIHRVTHSPGRA